MLIAILVTVGFGLVVHIWVLLAFDRFAILRVRALWYA